MPQPMSTPTAAGDTAPFIATTEPTVAPLPRCTSGMAATCDQHHGSDARLRSCASACGSTSSSGAHSLTGTWALWSVAMDMRPYDTLGRARRSAGTIAADLPAVPHGERARARAAHGVARGGVRPRRGRGRGRGGVALRQPAVRAGVPDRRRDSDFGGGSGRISARQFTAGGGARARSAHRGAAGAARRRFGSVSALDRAPVDLSRRALGGSRGAAARRAGAAVRNGGAGGAAARARDGGGGARDGIGRERRARRGGAGRGGGAHRRRRSALRGAQARAAAARGRSAPLRAAGGGAALLDGGGARGRSRGAGRGADLRRRARSAAGAV